VRITHDLSVDISGKNVILVEDIIDTGRTLDYLLRILKERGPKSLRLCTLLDKPEAREVPVKVDYHGFSISNEFVIGYGLDLDQRYRELPFIAQVQT
jgi:hypoxanthine phosphoribosyltransferase